MEVEKMGVGKDWDKYCKPKMEEFNLSSKTVNPYADGAYEAYILRSDVKEFIKERNNLDSLLIARRISLRKYRIRRDKLAGDKLK